MFFIDLLVELVKIMKIQ